MYFAIGIVELELALLDQRHRDHAGDGLGHREQAKDGLVGDRRLGDDVLHAEGFVIDRLAVLLDQDDGAGDLAGRDLVLEELADLGKLVLVEMRAGRNVEGAFGAGRRRCRQQQRAAGKRAQHIDVNSSRSLPGIRRGV